MKKHCLPVRYMKNAHSNNHLIKCFDWNLIQISTYMQHQTCYFMSNKQHWCYNIKMPKQNMFLSDQTNNLSHHISRSKVRSSQRCDHGAHKDSNQITGSNKWLFAVLQFYWKNSPLMIFSLNYFYHINNYVHIFKAFNGCMPLCVTYYRTEPKGHQHWWQ